MSDTDELSAELRDLRDRSATVPVPAPPRLEAITARGRRHRRARRLALAGLSVTGATAATALGLALIEAPAPTPAPPAMRSAAPTARHSVPARIRTAAYTIVAKADGTIALTIDPRELFDPTSLHDDLARYGIPALVTTDTVCSSDPAPGDISQVESFSPGPPGTDGTITIDPAALPAGSELSFGTVQLKGGVLASYSALIDPSAYTCTRTPPTTPKTTPLARDSSSTAPRPECPTS